MGRQLSPRALREIGPRVLQLAAPHWRYLVIGSIGLLGGSGINLLFPYVIGEVLNERLGVSIQHDLPMIAGGLIALFFIQALFFYIRHFYFHAVGYHVVAELRKRLYRAVMRQDIGFFDTASVGDLLSRLSSDTQVVQRAVTINISVALRYLIQVLGGTALMFYLSVRLTLVIILAMPLIMLGSMFWGKRLRRLSKKMQTELGAASGVAEESVGAVRTVRAFGGNSHELARYTAAIDDSLSTGMQRTKVAALFSSTMVFIMHASIALVLWYGGTLILSSTLSLGDLTAFVLYCVIVAVSFAFLASVWDEFMQAVGASERIFEVIDSEPNVVTPQQPRPIPDVRAGSVTFQNVSFAYPSRPDNSALRDVSFEISTGQTVAFVGPSGAGKSTIAALIPRFYDPQHGEIRYCDIPLYELDPEQLRAQIAVVAQDPQVFSVSIGENIRYGRLDASDDDVTQAARAANIHDFIESLPEGYDTLVGDRGIQLSGGQRQRVAIARAILKDPKFLILDEATSSLDSENEQLVQQALTRLMEDRTTLIIAHRLSTVQHADTVIVLKDGAITQVGSHQSLVEEVGLYQTLVEHQLL